MKIVDMRNELAKHGYTPEDLKGENKAALRQKLYSLGITSLHTTNEDPDNFEIKDDDVEVDPDNITEEISIEKDIPILGDKDWTSYVLKQLAEEELCEGNPTVDGLRRIIGFLVGPVVDNKVKIVQVPTIDNGERATVTYRIIVDIGDNTFRSYVGSADVSQKNTPIEFARHPVATAETRAEGRALRKALMLSKTITAEENHPISGADNIDASIPINSGQITFIEGLCKPNRLDININKFINSGNLQYKDISEIPYMIATRMLQKLSEYQQNSAAIPGSIKGYDPNWRQNNNE